VRIQDYGVLWEPNSVMLEDAVERHIAKGWQPHGGVAVWMDDKNKMRFAQAIVRFAAEEQQNAVLPPG
jgi:hypothetical protein